MLLDLQDCQVFHFHQKDLLRRTLKLTVLYRYCYPLLGYEENDDFSQSAVAISLNLFLFVIGGGAGYPSGIESKNASICDGQLFHLNVIETVSVNFEHFSVIKTGQERALSDTHQQSMKCNKTSKSGVASKSLTVTCE